MITQQNTLERQAQYVWRLCREAHESFVNHPRCVQPAVAEVADSGMHAGHPAIRRYVIAILKQWAASAPCVVARRAAQRELDDSGAWPSIGAR